MMGMRRGEQGQAKVNSSRIKTGAVHKEPPEGVSTSGLITRGWSLLVAKRYGCVLRICNEAVALGFTRAALGLDTHSAWRNSCSLFLKRVIS